MPSCSKTARIVLMIVVFPVPGPPVITDTPFLRDEITAFFCVSESLIELSFSLAAISFAASDAIPHKVQENKNEKDRNGFGSRNFRRFSIC